MLAVGLTVLAFLSGYGLEVVLLWLMPARLAIGLLAFGFDWLPHHPHDVRSDDDRYRATVVRPSPWLTPLLIYQNYHLIHHLYPAVPFYRYSRVWRAKEATLRPRRVRVL